MFVAVDSEVVAVTGRSDAVPETSVAAVAALHEAGIRVAMLTGDNRVTALSMSRSSSLVAVNALLLKRLRLPAQATGPTPARGDELQAVG